jgi:4'-phosphopantetheinyl transferase
MKLDHRDVQVWAILTDTSSGIVERFRQVLAPEETDRAGRFHFDRDRRSFVLARGALRMLLGYYLGVAPASVSFKYGSKGKPALAQPSSLEFNASHSGELAVFAFADGCEIGVDVEHIRPIPDGIAIANRFFSPEEVSDLLALPVEEQERAFYLCWSRKEAYIKATGDGLSAPLDQFRVTLTPDRPVRFIHLGQSTAAAEGWTLHDLQIAPDYAGALAYPEVRRPVSLTPVIDPEELLTLLDQKTRE